MTKKNTSFLVIAPLLIAGLFSGCQGGGGGSSTRVAGAVGTTNGTATPAPAVNSGAAGDTITLALRYVSFMSAEGTPVIDQTKAQEIVDRVNQLYGPCNIRFTLEEFIPAVPTDLGLPYGLTSMEQLDPTREQFDTMDKLVVINTGNWSGMGSANAWTNMPGYFPPGAVLEAQVATNAEIVAHELGHYLNLGHVNNPANLLNPIIYKTSTALTTSQCGTMRQSAVDSWSAARR